jgi:predicted nucleic acid-binding protein
MRIVVDTNVFISGVFFAGIPYEILDGLRTSSPFPLRVSA